MTTNVSFSNPTIPLLREAVERKLGHSIHSLGEINDLCDNHLNSRIGEVTIRRLWGLRKDGYDTIRRSTLDLLSQFAGYSNFDDFELYVKQNNVESGTIPQTDTILASSLHQGDTVAISWPPDRHCNLRYQGDNRFVVTGIENSRYLRLGCSFTVSAFMLNQPLQLHDLTFPDSPDNPTAYAIANKHGLSFIEVIT